MQYFQVTSHLSSISEVFVHDGAIGSLPKCDAKVRVISDSPAAVLSLSNFLWETPTRAVSHDSCPITVYAVTSIRYYIAFFSAVSILCFQESFLNALQSLQDALQDEGYFSVNFLLYAYLEYIGGVTH